MDYFYGTDTMILWVRKAVDDASGCGATTVKDLIAKIKSQLDNLRSTPNYYVNLLATYEAKKDATEGDA